MAIFKPIISITLIIVALSFSYYFVIYTPQKDKMQFEISKQDKQDRELKEHQAIVDARNQRCKGEADEKYNNIKEEAKQLHVVISFLSHDYSYSEAMEHCYLYYTSQMILENPLQVSDMESIVNVDTEEVVAHKTRVFEDGEYTYEGFTSEEKMREMYIFLGF